MVLRAALPTEQLGLAPERIATQQYPPGWGCHQCLPIHTFIYALMHSVPKYGAVTYPVPGPALGVVVTQQ